MALVSENLRNCGVKIIASVAGVPSIGSGVLYVTPNLYDYNYIITAKHIFQEDSLTPYNSCKVVNIEVLYPEKKEFKRLQFIKKNEIDKRLIVFKEDMAIIIVEKNENLFFRSIIVSEALADDDSKFFSWAIFRTNHSEINKFKFERHDPMVRRFKMIDPLPHQSLKGMSGAGIFIDNKNILHGIIYRYPNKNFENATIDCTDISVLEINKTLKNKKYVELDTEESKHKRDLNNVVIDIHQALVNNVCLDLELARKRLSFDIGDDWYHDPLKYIDLLNQDYLFKQFEKNFEMDNYEACLAEHFYIPKKQLTLRQALVSPFIDRIMYMAVVGVLAESLDSAMIPGVYSARYNRFSENQLIINGVEQWKKMRYKLLEIANLRGNGNSYEYGCVIEIDLLNFYDNINKNLLYEKIKRVCKNENEKNAADLLYKIISNFSKKELGLPQNSDASSLLASFYLNQVDTFMHHHAPAYYRFMDDIKIFCKDKYEARKILQTFEFELRRCHLSVNSQKTQIRSLGNDPRSLDGRLFDLELNKISRLRKSDNYVYLSEAFHSSVQLLQDNLSDSDVNDPEESARNLNYALNTIAFLGRKGIDLQSPEFEASIELAIDNLKEKPWITTQVCKVLNLISTEKVKGDFSDKLQQIVLEDRYNTYSFQTYQIWLLLAKHKLDSAKLKTYAVKQIEKNDETNRPVIGAMIIYMCSVDPDYRRVVIRKFGEEFTHKYFQNRIALIALRTFSPELIDAKHIDKSLIHAPEFTHKYKDKDLVFIPGFDEDDEDSENYLEQLYSI